MSKSQMLSFSIRKAQQDRTAPLCITVYQRVGDENAWGTKTHELTFRQTSEGKIKATKRNLCIHVCDTFTS